MLTCFSSGVSGSKNDKTSTFQKNSFYIGFQQIAQFSVSLQNKPLNMAFNNLLVKEDGKKKSEV